MTEVKSKPIYGSVEELGSDGIRARLGMAAEKRRELIARKAEFALNDVLGIDGAAEALADVRLRLQALDDGEEALRIALTAAEAAEERAATLARADEIDGHRVAASDDAAAIARLADLAEQQLAVLFQTIDDLRANEASLRRNLSAGRVDGGSWPSVADHIRGRLMARTRGLKAVFETSRPSGEHACAALSRFHGLPSIGEEIDHG